MRADIKVFVAALGFRVINSLLVQTYFVPDEYWQSLEPAHQLVFGSGYLTWEWKTGLRSYLHPLSVAFFYWLLKAFHLDSRALVVLVPRLVQAILAAVGDVFLFKLTRLLYGERIAYWTLISWALSWFGFFCMTRTLANSIETVLLLIGLFFYPWPGSLVYQTRTAQSLSDETYLAIAAATVIIRPTAAIFWLPLCLLHLIRVPNKRQFIRNALWSVAPVVLLCLLIDRICYGRWVISLWNFLLFNVVQGGSSFFGSHPWHWYITQGVPAVMFTHTILVGLGVYAAKNRLFLYLSLWYIFVHSFLAHKEFRFLMPVVPLLCIYTGIWLDHTSHFASRSTTEKKDPKATVLDMEGLPRSTRALLCLLFVSNVPLALYTGLIHQRGALDVTKLIHDRMRDKQMGSVWFLMPCHSTPYYSHIHTDATLRFLTCEPNFTGVSSYVEEADAFHSAPVDWVTRELRALTTNGSPLPDLLVMFDHIWIRLEPLLKANGYRRCSALFHTHFPQSLRQGLNITVACRKATPTAG